MQDKEKLIAKIMEILPKADGVVLEFIFLLLVRYSAQKHR